MFDLDELSRVDEHADEEALTARIAELERVKSAAAAGQAIAAAALDVSRRASEAAAGVIAAKRGRGVASEVALARRDSPARASRHLGFAKALVYEMPHTLVVLQSGILSEWRATLIVRESACLDVDDRRALDSELCADTSNLGDGRCPVGCRCQGNRLSAGSARRGRPHRKRRERPYGDHTARPGHHDLGHCAAAGRTGCRRLRGPAPRRPHHVRQPIANGPGDGRHPGRARHRSARRGTGADCGQCGDV